MKEKRQSPLLKRQAPKGSQEGEVLYLRRSCEAVGVPSGRKILLPAGTPVTLMQALGGSYAIMDEHGEVLRIAGKDADALGREVPEEARSEGWARQKESRDLEAWVWAELRQCYDPEVPVNIVDLGLVYHCQVLSLPEGKKRVEVKLTLTNPACGMKDWIKTDVEERLLGIEGVSEVGVEVVFEPPWDQSRMSEEAKRELGII